MKPINASDYEDKDLSTCSNEELQEAYLAFHPHPEHRRIANKILQEVHDRWGVDLEGNPNLAILE